MSSIHQHHYPHFQCDRDFFAFFSEILRKNAHYICEKLCISQPNILAKVWQKLRRKHSISRIFDSICTSTALPSVGGNSPQFPPTERSPYRTIGGDSTLRRVVRILRILAKYCKSLSFSQRFCKVLALFATFFVRDSIAIYMYSQLFAHFLSFCSACD